MAENTYKPFKTFDELMQVHPELFPEGFYFQCGEGWFPLIATLVHQIENIQFNRNWKGKPQVQYKFGQVKEKFGTLRIYSHVGVTDNDDGVLEQIYGAERFAEHYSAYVCEECGNMGRSRRGGWIRTLCDKHSAMAGYPEESTSSLASS